MGRSFCLGVHLVHDGSHKQSDSDALDDPTHDDDHNGSDAARVDACHHWSKWGDR
jgi:hypothetical protein